MEDLKARASKIIAVLEKKFPDAKCALDFSSPFELMIATILSAQCTDKRVNQITPNLFKKYSSIESFAKADIKELENDIHSAGFYHNKAKNIIGCAQGLISLYNGEIPKTLAELVKLPGVGRKTANCVLGNGFGLAEGIVVDTHVSRLCQKIGLTISKAPEKIEQELMRIVDKKHWINFSHWLILQGRAVCIARRPQCHICEIRNYCNSAEI